MTKETSSNDLQRWWQRWNNRQRRRNLLHMVKKCGAVKSTFTDGQGNFFMWSSMVVTVLERSPKAKNLLHMVENGGAFDSTFTNGQGNFFTWSSMMVTVLEQSPKAKKLLHMAKKCSAVKSTFTDGQGNFFKKPPVKKPGKTRAASTSESDDTDTSLIRDIRASPSPPTLTPQTKKVKFLIILNI